MTDSFVDDKPGLGSWRSAAFGWATLAWLQTREHGVEDARSTLGDAGRVADGHEVAVEDGVDPVHRAPRS